MTSEQTAPTRAVNIELCLYCAYYQALGCGGNLKFCTYWNTFLSHDPSGKACAGRAAVEGAD